MEEQRVPLRLLRLTLLVIPLILTSNRPAKAIPMFSVIQQQTTPFILMGAFAGYGTSFPFQYFDPALGTLQSVDIDVTGGNGNPQSFYSATLNIDTFCGAGLPPCDGEVIQG